MRADRQLCDVAGALVLGVVPALDEPLEVVVPFVEPEEPLLDAFASDRELDAFASDRESVR